MLPLIIYNLQLLAIVAAGGVLHCMCRMDELAPLLPTCFGALGPSQKHLSTPPVCAPTHPRRRVAKVHKLFLMLPESRFTRKESEAIARCTLPVWHLAQRVFAEFSTLHAAVRHGITGMPASPILQTAHVPPEVTAHLSQGVCCLCVHVAAQAIQGSEQNKV